MKTSNPSNRRFCDIGDSFYDSLTKEYYFCTNYFKRHRMIYFFKVFSHSTLKRMINDKDYRDKAMRFPGQMIGNQEIHRSYLDDRWNSGDFISLDPAQEAKLTLLGIKF